MIPRRQTEGTVQVKTGSAGNVWWGISPNNSIGEGLHAWRRGAAPLRTYPGPAPPLQDGVGSFVTSEIVSYFIASFPVHRPAFRRFTVGEPGNEAS